MVNYKVVVFMEYSDGTVEHVLWEPEMYGEMCYRNADFYNLFYETTATLSQSSLVDVYMELWNNPSIQKVTSQIGDKSVIREICIGTKILPLRRF